MMTSLAAFDAKNDEERFALSPSHQSANHVSVSYSELLC